MNPASKDIATLLNGESSIGLALGTDLFYSKIPSSPQNCVSIFDNIGSAPMLTLKKETSDYLFSSVNVQVRNTNYDNGYSVIKGIFDYLHGLHGLVIVGTEYLLIRAIDEPGLLAYDNNERPIFSVNFEIHRK
jgi:hypothetical protein